MGKKKNTKEHIEELISREEIERNFKEVKSRGWLTEIYEESAKENWREILSYLGQQCVISPIHDKDVTVTGEPKKAHTHVLLMWDGPTTYQQAKKVVDLIGSVGCLKCATIRGSIRYFCHLDNPEKYQYSVDDLEQIGGIDIEAFLMSESDEDVELYAMYNFIDQEEIISYREFVLWCGRNNETWFKMINRKYRENIFKFIRSLQYDIDKGYKDECRNKNKEKPARSQQEILQEEGQD